MLTGHRAEIHETGEHVGDLASVGCLTCVECGYALSLAALAGDLPRCPACGGSRFRRASLFEQPTVDAGVVDVDEPEPRWLDDVRAAIDAPGCHLAFHDRGETKVVEIEEGWMRIGRSEAAGLQLDDSTVSRRHALIIRTEEGELRALDDRSLNGLFINGERVEWAPLTDGDELEIGRYRLHVIDV